MHHDIRLAHTFATHRSEANLIFGRRTRQQQDAQTHRDEHWNVLAEGFNDQSEFCNMHDHVGLDEDGEDITSPSRATRIDISQLNPQHPDIFTGAWEGKELKAKWRDFKAIISPFLSKATASGHNKEIMSDDEDDADQWASISDFLPHPEGDFLVSGYTAPTGSKGQDRPRGEKTVAKEKAIKYVFLLFKGDKDLLGFASKEIHRGDVRENGCSDNEDDVAEDLSWSNNGTRAGRARRNAKNSLKRGRTAEPGWGEEDAMQAARKEQQRAAVADSRNAEAAVVEAEAAKTTAAAATTTAAAAQMAVLFPQYSSSEVGSTLRLFLAHSLVALMPALKLPETHESLM